MVAYNYTLKKRFIEKMFAKNSDILSDYMLTLSVSAFHQFLIFSYESSVHRPLAFGALLLNNTS